MAESTWTEKELEAFKRLYDTQPWNLTEIPILEVQAGALSAYLDYAEIIWGLQITQINPFTPHFLAQFPNLTYLDLSGCPDAYSQVEMEVEGMVGVCKSKDMLENILKACPNLTILKLSGNKDFSCLKNLHNLIKLNLSGCPQIMDLSVLKGFPKLQNLVLHDGTTLEKEKLQEFLSSL